jgi:hypothetical protein
MRLQLLNLHLEFMFLMDLRFTKINTASYFLSVVWLENIHLHHTPQLEGRRQRGAS